MTTLSSFTQKPAGGADITPLRAKWGWIVALGVVYVITGFVALGSVMMATVASVFVVGVMMIVAGIAEIINAFQLKGWGKFLIWALLGVLYIVAGFVTFENPLFAAAVLTLTLGMALIASGLVRIFLAFSIKREKSWIWLLLSSLVTLLLGILILAHWPINSVYVLGIFLGLDLVTAGGAWIGLGIALRRGGTHSAAESTS